MITYIYVCDECEIYEEHRHSIKERPTIACPCCGKVMVKDISGGSHAVVKGGKLNMDQQKAVDHKDRVDMQHANNVKSFIKNHAQPKTRTSFLKRDSVKGETQPATPGTRIKKPKSE